MTNLADRQPKTFKKLAWRFDVDAEFPACSKDFNDEARQRMCANAAGSKRGPGKTDGKKARSAGG
jgi:hypothetical protein